MARRFAAERWADYDCPHSTGPFLPAPTRNQSVRLGRNLSLYTRRTLMNRTSIAAALACALVALPVRSASGSLIDFEQTPAATTPVDDAVLNTPYAIPGGNVQFFFDTNGNNTLDG